jgi:hypothetical protein
VAIQAAGRIGQQNDNAPKSADGGVNVG